MKIRAAIILVTIFFALLIGCSQNGNQLVVKNRKKPSPPAPVKVKPFSKNPDALILFTGQNSGKLEVCNCAGPMPGGLARRSGLAISYRDSFENILLVDTGDLFSIYPDSLANKYILKAYRLMQYDAITLGDQEWDASHKKLYSLLRSGKMQYLSTSIKPLAKNPALPLKDAITRSYPRIKIAIVSWILPEAFLFFPEARKKKLAFKTARQMQSKIDNLKKAGYCVGAILHGEEEEVLTAADKINADFFLRGHSEFSEIKPLVSKAGKKIFLAGTPDYVGVLAIFKTHESQKYSFEYRIELVDKRWPVDKRMLEIYQAYAHAEMRKQLDAERKKSLNFVASKKCGQCHAAQYAVWEKSAHSKAWLSLAKVKRTIDPNCVTCHSLGFGMQKGFYTFQKTPELAGVHCQSCHRINISEHLKPGFKAMPVTKIVCETCHTPVTDPRFDSKQISRFKKMGCRKMKAK